MIQAGWAKGLKLTTPRSQATRPTSAKLRAAIGDILRSRGNPLKILDLYSGSGAVGLETLSQGGESAYFIEKSHEAFRCLQQNAKNVIAKSNGQLNKQDIVVKKSEVMREVQRLQETEMSFDFIWADPPYPIAVSEWKEFAPVVANLLTQDGVLMLESAASDSVEIEAIANGIEQLVLEKQRKYGDTVISVLSLRAEDES